MTKAEQQQKLQELNYDLNILFRDSMQKSFDIIIHHFNHEKDEMGNEVSRIEKIVALYDITNLMLLDATAELGTIYEDIKKRYAFTDMFFIPHDEGVDKIMCQTKELKEHIEALIKILAIDTKTVYDLYTDTYGDEKDLNIQGNPLCATNFFRLSSEKFKEMENIRMEVTSD